MTVVWNPAAATDTGCLRDANEDRFWMDPARGVYLVVDGVGGQAAGALAAETAVESVRATILEPGAPEHRIRHAITAANNRIFQLAALDPSRTGMACVLTLAVVEDGTATIGHVGDSRLYLISNGSMKKITSDHSPVGEEEDAGELSEAEAMMHPRRNEVFRDVGSRSREASDEGFIEIRRCRLRSDSALLLCSDGLTGHLTAAQVREIIGRYQGDAQEVAGALVEAANAAGGRDNITALFVAGPRFRASDGATRPRFSTTGVRSRVHRWTGRIAFLVYGLVLAMIVWAVMRLRG